MEGIGAAHEKTFDWIFDDVEETASNSFCVWLQGTREEGLYWIYGKAGSGKSTLMKYICKDPRTQEKLQQWAKDDPLTIVSFFF
jgi:ABC-type ATPase involved in cell division